MMSATDVAFKKAVIKIANDEELKRAFIKFAKEMPRFTEAMQALARQIRLMPSTMRIRPG
jgi:hypothetical protein